MFKNQQRLNLIKTRLKDDLFKNKFLLKIDEKLAKTELFNYRLEIFSFIQNRVLSSNSQKLTKRYLIENKIK